VARSVGTLGPSVAGTVRVDRDHRRLAPPRHGAPPAAGEGARTSGRRERGAPGNAAKEKAGWLVSSWEMRRFWRRGGRRTEDGGGRNRRDLSILGIFPKREKSQLSDHSNSDPSLFCPNVDFLSDVGSNLNVLFNFQTSLELHLPWKYNSDSEK
jgi:hypothetical protein